MLAQKLKAFPVELPESGLREDEDNYLPLHGISVDFLLEHFVPLYHKDGRDVERFVYEITHPHNCSFADLLQKEGTFAGAVAGRADVFVSFSYQADFYEVLSALEEHRKHVVHEDFTVWMSLFSFNLGLEKRAEPLCEKTEWFRDNFSRVVKEIGRTLLVISCCLRRGFHLDQSRKTRKEVTYFKPDPLERLWVLAELALTLQHGCALEICMSRIEKDGFVRLLFRKGDPLFQPLRKVRMKNGKINGAYEGEKRRILQYFEGREGGVEAVDRNIRGVVREWYMGRMEATVEDVREFYSRKENLQAFTVLLNNVGMLFESQGNSAKAEKYFRESKAMRLEFYGDRHANYAGSLTNLAGVLHDQGKVAEAERLCEEALDIYTESYGEKHELVASGLNDLARVLQDQGKYEEAKALLQQALEIHKELTGEESEPVADALNNLGYVFLLEEDFGEARRLFELALEIDSRFYGEEHSNVSIRLNNISATYRGEGALEEAKSHAQDALKVASVYVGRRHPLYAQSLLNLAEAEADLNEHKEALPNFREAAAIFKQCYGETNEKFARARNGLTASLRKGETEELEEAHGQMV